MTAERLKILTEITELEREAERLHDSDLSIDLVRRLTGMKRAAQSVRTDRPQRIGDILSDALGGRPERPK